MVHRRSEVTIVCRHVFDSIWVSNSSDIISVVAESAADVCEYSTCDSRYGRHSPLRMFGSE